MSLIACLPRRRGLGPVAPPGTPVVDVWPQIASSLFQDNGTSVPVTTAGQTVQRVLDSSGNNRHASQANATNAPQYATNLGPAGNLAGLDFLASGAHWLKIDAFTSPATTYFFVYAVTSTAGTIFNRVRTSNGAAADYIYKPNEVQGDRGSAHLIATNSLFPDSNYHLGCLRIEPGGTTKIEVYLDGVLVASYASSIGTTDLDAALLIGAYSELGAYPARLLLLRFLIYHSALNSPDRRIAEAYLQGQYGTPALP